MSQTTLLDERETLTPADHQTHRRYDFDVPQACEQIDFHVRYTPKFLSGPESAPLVAEAIRSQRTAWSALLGKSAEQELQRDSEASQRVPNLITVSLDDAEGAYRGAGHRHAEDQHLGLGTGAAHVPLRSTGFTSPGLVAGPLPAGTWTLTLSVHTLASAQCEVSIQIGAVIASNRP